MAQVSAAAARGDAPSFCPPANVIAEFPQFPVTKNYDELRAEIIKASRAD